jgi:hypothetical protein
MKDKLEELYILLENSYIKKMKEKDSLNNNIDNIFPNDWYRFKDYKLKIEILTESLDKNILIKDNELYKKSIREN